MENLNFIEALGEFWQKIQNKFAPEAHITDPSAHPDIREAIGVVKDKIAAIEVASGVEVTANPFAVTFGSLDGITADGVWNATAARMEF